MLCTLCAGQLQVQHKYQTSCYNKFNLQVPARAERLRAGTRRWPVDGRMRANARFMPAPAPQTLAGLASTAIANSSTTVSALPLWGLRSPGTVVSTSEPVCMQLASVQLVLPQADYGVLLAFAMLQLSQAPDCSVTSAALLTSSTVQAMEVMRGAGVPARQVGGHSYVWGQGSVHRGFCASWVLCILLQPLISNWIYPPRS